MYWYQIGIGVEKNVKKAFEFCEKAANQGHSEAQYELGRMYKDGRCVKKNYKKAFEFYEKAAKQCNPRGQHALARMYEYNEEIDKNFKKAIEWYEESGKQGLNQAYYSLGKIMLKKTTDGIIDYNKACQYFNKHFLLTKSEFSEKYVKKLSFVKLLDDLGNKEILKFSSSQKKIEENVISRSLLKDGSVRVVFERIYFKNENIVYDINILKYIFNRIKHKKTFLYLDFDNILFEEDEKCFQYIKNNLKTMYWLKGIQFDDKYNYREIAKEIKDLVKTKEGKEEIYENV